MRAADRLALLQTALRRLAFARAVSMDAGEVRRILDLLHACVDAERDGNGMLGTRDVQRAVHRAYTRLAAGLDPAQSAHRALDRAALRAAPDALAGTDLPGLALKTGLWYATGPTQPLQDQPEGSVQAAALPGTRGPSDAPQKVHVLGLAGPAAACYGLCFAGAVLPHTTEAIPVLAVDGAPRTGTALRAAYPEGTTFLLP